MKLVIVDSHKAWAVTIGSTIINCIVCGFIRVYSMIIVEYQDLLDAPMALLMLSASFIDSLVGLTAPLSTYLSETYTTWKIGIFATILSSISMMIIAFAYNIYVLLLATVILGFANSLLFVPSMSFPGKCHIKRQSLSHSITFTGGSFGGIIMPLGMSFLSNMYSFRGMMVIMAGYVLHFAIGSILMPTHIIEIKNDYKPEIIFIEGYKNKKESSMIQIGRWKASYKRCSEKSKWIWPPRRLWRTLILYSLAFARYMDISRTDTAYYLMIQSIVDCLVRLSVGYLSDLRLLSRWVWYGINAVLLCFISILVGIYPTMILFQIYTFCYAVFGAFIIVLPILVYIDALGIEFVNICFTSFQFSKGVMEISISYAIGYFCDVTLMYNYAILIIGVTIGLGVSLILIDRWIELFRSDD